jgi:NADH-quinone oxidoreductase subunit M
MPTLLLILLGLPLAGAAAVGLLGPGRADLVRRVSLYVTLVALALALVLAAQFSLLERSALTTYEPEMVPGSTDIAPHATTWDLLRIGGGAVQFYLGVDGLNVWLVVLTALLMVASVLGSWTAIEDRANEFYAWLLALETAMIGVFLAFDLFLFYVFFELTLVPLFFLIGIWGGPQRQYAARKFFVYTLAGSLITLLGALGIALVLTQPPLAQEGGRPLTFSIPELVKRVTQVDETFTRAEQRALAKTAEAGAAAAPAADAARGDLEKVRADIAFWRRVQFWVFVAMMVGFAVKVPMFPVHTWLPLAHVEAPTAGSVLLAGILLKLGTYGFLRLCVPLAPDAALSFGAPLLGSLAVVGIIYGAFCALAQDDMKKLVAYSSVSHLGYCMLGLFALNEVGLTGSLVQMVNHGLSTGAMFLLVGFVYERYHTRKLADYGGLGARLKLLGAIWVFIGLSSVALPGLNGFVGEFLVMAGMFDFRGAQVDGRFLTSLAAVGVVLGAWYTLTLLRRILFGPVHEPDAHHAPGQADARGRPEDPEAAHERAPAGDLNGRELGALLPIAAVCLAIGVYPKFFLDTVRPDLRVVSRVADRARVRSEREAQAARAQAAPAAVAAQPVPAAGE